MRLPLRFFRFGSKITNKLTVIINPSHQIITPPLYLPFRMGYWNRKLK
jgi:hypothetical protein